MKSKMKDMTPCLKCGRIYCVGYWEEGVCIADMHFSQDPTACGDEIAEYVRTWYEIHRESWWDRHNWNADRSCIHADEFMLAFLQEVGRVEAEAKKQLRL